MKRTIINLIHFYQYIMKSFNVHVCRFYPTCSEYMIQSITKYGIVKGIIKGLNRIARCHPFNAGGYDPVK